MTDVSIDRSGYAPLTGPGAPLAFPMIDVSIDPGGYTWLTGPAFGFVAEVIDASIAAGCGPSLWRSATIHR